MFEKNIKLLEQVNKTLANKIRKISIEDASKQVGAIKTESEEYILTCDNKFVDDTPSPLESAKKIYSDSVKTCSSRYDFIIIFGLGLGNLLDYTHTKSICSLIVYEPNLNILRFTLEYVDFTKYFADGRLFIANNLNECTNYISDKYLLDDKIEFVYLKNYTLQHQSEFTVLTERIFSVCQQKIIDMNTIKKMSKVWINNIFANISNIETSYPINLLENTFKNKTALILGAGPSLKDNINKIKENRDKFVIFAVHRTLNTLHQNDITPDFCVVIDSKWLKNSMPKETKFLEKINLIADIKADKYLKNFQFKNNFIYYSKNNFFSKKLEEKIPTELKTLETGGSATVCAYNCAKFLGFKDIIFAGLDLAFKDDTVYCDGQIATMDTAQSVKIQNIVRATTQVKSITGEYVSTRVDYANFIKQFEYLFLQNKSSNIYNLTTFGAFINGMKYMQLEEILEHINSDCTKTDEIISQTTNNKENLQKSIKNTSDEILSEEYKKIKKIVDLIEEWFEMYLEHPNFFEYATNIVTSITSTMMLQEFVQIEIIKFSKLVLSKNDEEKKSFLVELFKNILKYSKNLYNLINIEKI